METHYVSLPSRYPEEKMNNARFREKSIHHYFCFYQKILGSFRQDEREHCLWVVLRWWLRQKKQSHKRRNRWGKVRVRCPLFRIRLTMAPLGYESVIFCTDPDPSINKQKKQKNLGVLTFLWLLNDLLLLKTEVYVPTVSTNKQKKLLASWESLTKRAGSGIQFTDPRIYIRIQVSQIRNTAWGVLAGIENIGSCG